jgi:hypothetical protein
MVIRSYLMRMKDGWKGWLRWVGEASSLATGGSCYAFELGIGEATAKSGERHY